MRTLLIDNYDSYTFNLFQLLAEINGAEPLVVRNDQLSWEELQAWEFDNVVVSPGPGHPDEAQAMGVSRAALSLAKAPILGVCLGHQGLAAVAGGSVRRAPEIMHGQTSRIFHCASSLFDGLPQGFTAVRYHSLAVRFAPSDELEELAWADDGVIMALRHRRRPAWGVQFHPESVATEWGRRLLENFRDLTCSQPRRRGRGDAGSSVVPHQNGQRPRRAGRLALHVRELAPAPDAEAAFVALYGDSRHAFWLDSSLGLEGLSRFSFMGDDRGALSSCVRYDVHARRLTIDRPDGSRDVRREGVFEHLERELAAPRPDGPALPFEFAGGFVGWLGYELQRDCGARRAHRSAHPDAALIFADRFLAFDHLERRVHLVCLSREGDAEPAEAWLDETQRRLLALGPAPPLPVRLRAAPVLLTPRRGLREYLYAIEECKRCLQRGDSYEICLTNQLHATEAPDPLELYRHLRVTNPAPYSAYLRFDSVAVACSSPERFLLIDAARGVESKPIKGTAPRAAEEHIDLERRERLRVSSKDRAENLMIVDLLRNDLGLVCEIGSVHVSSLMAVETYETVHQLVSTIRGVLRPDIGIVDCIRAAFPGGSMTGAPKIRTMDLIHDLEGGPRGIYSGAIGTIGLGGVADLNIVIRTLVQDPGGISMGVGGAIVHQSDPQGEVDELLLKGRAPAEALSRSLGAPHAVVAGAPAVAAG